MCAADHGEILPDEADDLVRTAMRQMTGVFTQLDRAMIAKRLRDGRRIKAARAATPRGVPAPDMSEDRFLDRELTGQAVQPGDHHPSAGPAPPGTPIPGCRPSLGQAAELTPSVGGPHRSSVVAALGPRLRDRRRGLNHVPVLVPAPVSWWAVGHLDSQAQPIGSPPSGLLESSLKRPPLNPDATSPLT